MAPAPYVAAVPVFTWTGFYFGVNAGYAWSDNNQNDNLAFAPGTFGTGTSAGTISFGNNGNTDGFAGGGQVGFNYQFTPGTGFVVGIEADIQALDLSNDRNNTFTTTGGTTVLGAGGVPAGFQPIRNDLSSLDWFGTVRGRLGYAFDRTLVYATGGFAYAGGNNDSDCGRFVMTSSACSSGNDNTRWGYAVGGGVEFALPMAVSLFGSSAMTFKIEGLYVNLDESDNNNARADLVGFTAVGAPVFNGGGAGNGVAVRNNRDDHTDFALVRAGINFKF
jgi:outer membrane immunogenic protein